MPRVRPLCIAVFLLALAPAPRVGAQAERPSCGKVMGAVTSEISARRGRAASPRTVARQLGTDPGWVRQCMSAYGRRPAVGEKLTDEERENEERAYEEGRSITLNDDNKEESWERKRQIQIERQERRDVERELARQREFDESQDPFYKESEY